MQRRISRTAPGLARALLSLGIVGSAACAGTPLPEPPDELPTPDIAMFARDTMVLVSQPEVAQLVLEAGASAAEPGTRVWIVNLDTNDPPTQVTAGAQGGFKAPGIAAGVDDRVRILYRTERQHSAPLDLRTVMPDAVGASLDVALLPEVSLTCLHITPLPALTLRSSRGTLQLENDCGVPVDLTRVALRLGDQGISLAPAPARLAAGEDIVLKIEDAQGAGASERLEIVLIDATASDGRTGRFAIDVFTALK